MPKQKKSRTSPAPKKAPAKRAAKKASPLDLTPVETIRISSDDAASLEALRLFVKVYEKL